MNAIDIIEGRKLAEGISSEELCRRTEGRVSGTMYGRYLLKDTSPTFETIVILMKAVNLKLVATDIGCNVKIDSWAILDMYVRLNQDFVFNCFKDATGLMFMRNKGNLTLLSTILYFVWFYKNNKRKPENPLVDSMLLGELQSGDVTLSNYLSTIITLQSQTPTSASYEFYEKVVNGLDSYLNTANILTEITE